MNTMQVKAKEGIKVPMEEKPRVHIDDKKAVTVPENAYYLRRIADGDLIRQEAKPASSNTSKGAK
jgi:hypothetical protein